MESCNVSALFRVVRIAGLGLALAGGTDAQTVKLSGPLAQSKTRQIHALWSSPDGTRVLYWGDQDENDVEQLYSVSVMGPDARVRVSALPTVAGGDVGGGIFHAAPFARVLALASSGERVVFSGDLEVDGRVDLYSAKLGGGPVVRLTGSETLDLRNALQPFQVSPDGARVVYQTSFRTLRVVPIDGGPSVRLDGSAPFGGVFDFLVSPSGNAVVYRAPAGAATLFVVPIDGSAAPLRLSGIEHRVEATSHYRLTLDGKRVLYREAESERLFSVSLFGRPQPLPISAAGENVADFVLAPDGRTVVYRTFSHALLSVPVDGSHAPVALAEPGRAITDYRVTAGGRLVFRSDRPAVGRFELFSVPLDGSANARRLNATLPSGGDVEQLVGPTPDGTRVLYLADQAADERFELFSVRADGGAAPVNLSRFPLPTSDVQAGAFALSPDGSRVAFLAGREGSGVFPLFAAPTDGSRDPVELSAPLAPGREVLPDFLCTADGSHWIYRADHERNDVHELHVVPLDGGALAEQRTHTPVGPTVGSVYDFAPTADGTRVVYRAESEDDGVLELFSVPAGGGEPVRLNGPLVADGDVGWDFVGTGAGESFLTTPDGQSVVFFADTVEDERRELFLVPLDGSVPPVRLSGGMVNGGSVGPSEPTVTGSSPLATPFFAFEPGGDGLVYLATARFRTRSELFRVELAVPGSSQLLSLNGGGEVCTFALPPAGTRVVYIANQPGQDVRELWSVPLDGSAPPVRLHAQLPPDRDVTLFAQSSVVFSPDGTQVLFVADLESNGVFELYRVPVDGSAPPAKLNQPLVPGGDVRPGAESSTGSLAEFVKIGSDGLRCVYLASAFGIGHIELFSRPLDGSTPSVRLNPDLVTFGAVQPLFLLSPDSARVVYVADQRTDTVWELFSAPADGSAPAVRLNATLPNGGDVAGGGLPRAFPALFAPGGLAVYVADQETNNVQDLYRVPQDGSGSPSVLSQPAPADTDVELDQVQLSADGRRVLYVRRGASRELVQAPLLGGAAPITLSPPAAHAVFIEAFVPAPGGESVLYRADLDESGVQELYATELVRPWLRAR